MNKKLFYFLMLLLFVKQQVKAQGFEVSVPGIHVSGGTAYASQVSSNIGTSCNATGQNSFAGGYLSNAQGSCSFAFGNNATASQNNSFALGSSALANTSTSFAIGFNISIGQSSSIIIGSGYSSSRPLTDNNSGILLGVGSTKPTLYISKAAGIDSTGKVAIGDVRPQAKLHIRSDLNEDAGIIVVAGDPTENNSFIQLGDSDHHLTLNTKGDLELSSGLNNRLLLTSENINIKENWAVFGSSGRRLYYSTYSTPSISSNAKPTSTGYNRETYGPSYTLEFRNEALVVRTAPYMQPRGDQITNWYDAVTIGIDHDITLNGKVGVNTENTTDDYALAVAGGVITTKVHIQDVNNWQDCVFGDDYHLMPLCELETYVSTNHHLPGIPSEAEVRADGYDMAKMQAAFLGKIEELTLYMLRQQKELDSLRDLVTIHFGYDACGNRINRTLEFQRVEGGKDEESDNITRTDEELWFASLNDTYAGAEVCLFPNPTEGKFNLSIKNKSTIDVVTAKLCTITGVVLEERFLNGGVEEFDLTGRPSGIFLLQLYTEGEIRTWKIIKRN